MRDHKVSLNFGAFRRSAEVTPQATTSKWAGKSASIEMRKARLAAGSAERDSTAVLRRMPPKPLPVVGFVAHGTRVTHRGYL